jgi:hypothetical protein
MEIKKMEDKILMELEEGLAEIPLLDAHTHIDAGHLSARGLHDILLYHMVISDLVSAGCPNRARLSEEPDDSEIESRLVEAIPYVKYIQNTSCFWGVRIILKDLYGWTEPITQSNWKKIHEEIYRKSKVPSWSRDILKKAKIKQIGTELWRRKDGSADDILKYALEWAFFTRNQWGVNDIPLYELERAWNQPGPGAPLPVTMGSGRPKLDRIIRTVDDVHKAIKHYCDNIPYDQVSSTAQHISTDINFRDVRDGEMAEALKNRDNATTADRDIYASFILEKFLNELEKHGDEIVYQFSFGAEPLPFETGSKLRPETIFELAKIVEQHPKIRFQVFLSSEHANQAICTLARELPNFSVCGYWWHNFFPGTIRKVISERLDMLAMNKQIGFFSDAYCVDWAYAKSVIVKKQWAEVLAQKVKQGQYTIDEALAIAHQTMYETAKTLLWD